MPFQIIRNDITKVSADVIVNTANPEPIYGAGTDEAIYKAAGKAELLKERKKIGDIKQGEIAVTQAFSLSAKYIIHTVGPIWTDGKHGEFDVLKNCYKNSLDKALELGCESIAFPLISSGTNEFPKDKALSIATSTISEFLMRDDVDMLVNMVVFDDRSFRLSKKTFLSIESYIDDESVIEAYKKEYELTDEDIEEGRSKALYERERSIRDHRRRYKNSPDRYFHEIKPLTEDNIDLDDYKHTSKDDKLFRDTLMKFLIEKDIDNNDAYHRSNIDRRSFSKLLTGKTANPKKSTVFALCIGLDLDLEESSRLLESAGLSFSFKNNWDRLVKDIILSGQKDFGEINSIMIATNHPQLGLAIPQD